MFDIIQTPIQFQFPREHHYNISTCKKAKQHRIEQCKDTDELELGRPNPLHRTHIPVAPIESGGDNGQNPTRNKVPPRHQRRRLDPRLSDLQTDTPRDGTAAVPAQQVRFPGRCGTSTEAHSRRTRGGRKERAVGECGISDWGGGGSKLGSGGG